MPKSKSTDSEQRYVCCQCGNVFNSLQEFNKSYSSFFPATEHLPVCKSCLTKKFNNYALKYKSPKQAMKRICMAYDLYYNDSIFDKCINDNTNDDVIVGNYIRKLNMAQYKGRTFDTSLQEGFSFTDNSISEKPSKEPKKDEQIEIPEEDLLTWGDGFDYPEDYNILNSHYKYLTTANPQYDGNQGIFINDLCYTKMLQMKALREGRVDDYNKLTESYRKSFSQAGLKTIRENNVNEEFTIGVNAEIIEKYTPAEYYKNKELYKDYDNLSDYISRFLLRPLRNLMHGSKDRDYEFYVKDEDGDDNGFNEEN